MLNLFDIARLPEPSDNVAIATRRIESGCELAFPDGKSRRLQHTVLLGHRIAARSIRRGEFLLSWGLPFGTALRDIEPGDYVCNQLALDALAARHLPEVVLPASPSFDERLPEFRFDEANFVPAGPPAPAETAATFDGYVRTGSRGVGTRNYVVILGTSSRSASAARTVAQRLRDASAGVSGIVPVAHTEGGGAGEPNNRSEILRVLAGFMVHPNVGAVVAIDEGTESVNNAALRAFLTDNDYPIDHVRHTFLSLASNPAEAIRKVESLVHDWLPALAAEKRSSTPVSALKLALQCGGSDAFSGVSANPLAAAVAREIIRHGGCANQAETDELVGAEAYMLRHTRDLETARRFLAAISRFKERMSWHGESPEGNPSAGNRLRGLYNIALKSLGAAAKKAPDVRLDHVIDYGDRIPGPGFTFMDSPGNDLESIAGQVASGCNLIVFTTGNGSITNFPFVPTIKVTSTTERHEWLINEMDVNAGAYLDGEPMESLTRSAFDLAIGVASGRRTKGERAGHSQVSIWRDWRQTAGSDWQAVIRRPRPDGLPLRLAHDDRKASPDSGSERPVDFPIRAIPRVGLVLPTSLCAGQIARLAAERLNASGHARRLGIKRFVALPHTEGCGFAGERLQDQLLRTYAAYGTHANAAMTLFLEHGCERTPNDLVRRHLIAEGFDPAGFGWASIQGDGGIERVLGKIENWFAGQPESAEVDPAPPAVGILTEGPLSDRACSALADFARVLIESGGSILIPETDALTNHQVFRQALVGEVDFRPTLEWAGRPLRRGLHIVATETSERVENATGLGACGARVILAAGNGGVEFRHPFIPVVRRGRDFEAGTVFEHLRRAIEHDVASEAEMAVGDFQITRGLLGVSA